MFHIIRDSLKTSEHRIPLIEIKRNIYNERELTNDDVKLLESYFTQGMVNKFKKYQQLKNDIEKKKYEAETLYRKEKNNKRVLLQKLTKKANFQNGLVLSSKSLLQSIRSYYHTTSPEHFDAKCNKMEPGIMRYVSRLHTKTSPFSTFTNIGAVKIVTTLPDSIHENGYNLLSKPHNSNILKSSRILINTYVYESIINLLIQDSDISKHLLIRFNPTIKKVDGNFLFLTNFRNIEAFQRIKVNPFIEFMLTMVDNTQNGVALIKFIEVLEKNGFVNASREEIEQYIRELINYGFFEYYIGVSGLDPNWVTKMIDMLNPISTEVPCIYSLTNMLRDIRTYALQYEKSDTEERVNILEKAYVNFKDVYEELYAYTEESIEEKKSEHREIENSGGKTQIENSKNEKTVEFKRFNYNYAKFDFKAEKIFYEDTAIKTSLYLDEEIVQPSLSSLNRLLTLLEIFDHNLGEKDRLSHYFITKYGENSTIDLLTLYENYYRDYKIHEIKEAANQSADQKTKKEKNQNDTNSLESEFYTENKRIIENAIRIRRKNYQDILNNIMDDISKQFSENTNSVIRIPYESLEKIINQHNVLKSASTLPDSRGVFVQYYFNDNNRLIGVLNASFPGYGKMYSRFLHLFDEKLTRMLYDWNDRIHDKENVLAIENCDASVFNANWHPPLLPYEIWIPGAQNNLPFGQHIPITDLLVEYDVTSKKLHLLHKKTRKRVYIFDLGFQAHGGRSKLFRLLDSFTGTKYVSCGPILNAINRKSLKFHKFNENPNSVWSNPRILYDDHWVLQRKSWFVPITEVKSLYKGTQESDWSYYCRINDWRIRHKIPMEVFIYVLPREYFSRYRPEQLRNINRDDYKPQYMNFNNTLLIDLFSKVIKRVPGVLKMEEMLPNSEQLLKINEKKYVTEFLFQWYNGIREV